MRDTSVSVLRVLISSVKQEAKLSAENQGGRDLEGGEGEETGRRIRRGDF